MKPGGGRVKVRYGKRYHRHDLKADPVKSMRFHAPLAGLDISASTSTIERKSKTSSETRKTILLMSKAYTASMQK